MGSSPTLAHAASGHDSTTDPAVRAAEDGYGRLNPWMAYAWPNPYRPGVRPDQLPRTRPDGPQTRRELVRMFEDISARSYQVWLDEHNESPPTLPLSRLAGLRYRATRAQQLAAERAAHARANAEAAFDRLNPDFGVPADTLDPAGRQAVRDREAGLALGTRVAVAASRENDPPRSSGWPGRTTAPPTPPAPPATPPGRGAGPNAAGRSDDPRRRDGKEVSPQSPDQPTTTRPSHSPYSRRA
jgi:hypothetical protein